MKTNFKFNQKVRDIDENTSEYIRVSLDCTPAEKAWCKQNWGTSLSQLNQEYLDFIGLDKEGNNMSILNSDLDDWSPGNPPDEQYQHLEALFNSATTEIKELNYALTIIKKFCADNGFDLSPLLGRHVKQISEMTREEIMELNKGVTERQSVKTANNSVKASMPTYEDQIGSYEESQKDIPIGKTDLKSWAAIFILKNEIELLKRQQKEEV